MSTDHQYHYKSFQIIRDFDQQNPLKGISAPSVMSGHVVTHDGVPRDYRRCRCHTCGVEDVCTPRTDFKPREPKGPLFCGRCS